MQGLKPGFESVRFSLDEIQFVAVAPNRFKYRCNEQTEDGFTFHSHNAFEFHYVTAGVGELKTSHRTYQLNKGTAVLLGKHMQHLLRKKDASEFVTFNVLFDFASEVFEIKHDLTRLLKELTVFETGNDPEIDGIVDAIIKIEARPSAISSLALSSYLSLLLLRFYSLWPESDKTQQEPQDDLLRMNILCYTVIDKFFMTNLDGNRKAEELAEQLNVSCRHLHRLLQKYYGMSFREKQLETRLSAAKNYLLDSDYSIARVAEKCGYSYPSSFTTAFRKQFGCSPFEYRKQHSAKV